MPSAVLCVDDEPMVTRALRSLLDHHLPEIDVIEVAESGEEALEVADELVSDGLELKAVIADYIMPQLRGDELLVRLHQRVPQTKKIMLTGHSDIGGVKRAINEAQLYRFIEKPWQNDDLVLTLRGALQAYDQERELDRQNAELRQLNADLRALNEALEIKVAERTQALEQKNLELERLAVTDRLTGLSNRLQLDRVLARELSRSARYGTAFSVVMLDIDHFKRINDTHGHPTGDQVLREIAEILHATVRQSDRLGRWGGEEFLLICPETDLAGARRLAENQRAAIQTHPFPTVGHCTASFGVSQVRTEDTAASLVARADAALYQAKTAGRNRVEVA